MLIAEILRKLYRVNPLHWLFQRIYDNGKVLQRVGPVLLVPGSLVDHLRFSRRTFSKFEAFKMKMRLPCARPVVASWSICSRKAPIVSSSTMRSNRKE
jgi:hypothetical protein